MTTSVELEHKTPAITAIQAEGSLEAVLLDRIAILEAENKVLQAENLALRTEMQRREYLSSAAAHDVKNALTPPVALLQLAMRPGTPAEKIVEWIPAVAFGVMAAKNKLIAFPDQLMISGELKREPIDITASLQNLSSDIVNTARKVDEDTMGNLELQFDSPAEPQIINGDSEYLNAAFTDLMINAIQAMSGYPVKQLSISIQPGEKTVSIFIKDNGAGIPANIKDRIFDKGFTTKADGNGNGLYNVQNRIAAHGGKIQIKETGPAGTAFEIILPV